MLGCLFTCFIAGILVMNQVYATELLPNNSTTSCLGENSSIAQLQGEGQRSPYVIKSTKKTETVSPTFTVAGVVTQLKRGRHAGFFMQQASTSALNLASRGIFVHTTSLKGLIPNRVVCVTGVVEEHYGMTELRPTAEIIKLEHSARIIPTNILIAAADAHFRETLERYEGMRVRLVSATDMRVTKPLNYNKRWQRYNLILSHQSVNIHPNTTTFPGSILADQHALDNKQRRLLLDLPDELPLLDILSAVSVTDKITGVVGVLQFSYGEFSLLIDSSASKIQFDSLTVQSAFSSSIMLERAAKHLRIASFNLLNYFNTLAGGVHNPLRHNRGANTLPALHFQEAKLVETIVALDADFIGLMEMENNGFGQYSAVKRLLDLVNLRVQDPDKRYKMVVPGKLELHQGRYLGTGAITVAAFYRPSKLQLHKTRVINLPMQRSVLGNAYHRPALTPSFIRVTNGHPTDNKILTISVNHFKSKGSKCIEDKQRSMMIKRLKLSLSTDNEMSLTQRKAQQRLRASDRQGSCAQFRTLAASVLAHALAKQGGDKIILGDLNSYPKEDPLLVLTDYQPKDYAFYQPQGSKYGYLDKQLSDPIIVSGFGYYDPFINYTLNNWTYSFQALGRLDYILISPSLLPKILARKVWHINTKQSHLFVKNKQVLNKVMHSKAIFPSSDHDPLFIDLK